MTMDMHFQKYQLNQLISLLLTNVSRPLSLQEETYTPVSAHQKKIKETASKLIGVKP